jgi:hypothetical protein
MACKESNSLDKPFHFFLRGNNTFCHQIRYQFQIFPRGLCYTIRG